MATLKYKTQNGYEPLPAMVVRKTNAENGNGIGTCSTSSGTALTVSLANYELVQNGFIAVSFEHDVPANATLNVNGKGAKPIYYKGSAITADTIKADDTVMFCYNGSQYVVTSLGGGGAAPINPNETVNISLTQVGGSSADLIGAAVTITDDDSGDTLYTGTWAGTMLTTEIDVNTNYTVSVSTISGYSHPASQSYQAGYQTEKNISFNYLALGAFIEATDGSLYTSAQWSSAGKTASCVVLRLETRAYRIALTEIKLPFHSNNGDNFGAYMTNTYTTQAAADADYNGEMNTEEMIRANTAYGTNTTTYAAPYCYATIFRNNQHGYLPSAGEIGDIMKNKTAVNSCLTACGGSGLTNEYWTSSYAGAYNDSYKYCYWWTTTSAVGKNSGTTSNTVRPIARYE